MAPRCSHHQTKVILQWNKGRLNLSILAKVWKLSEKLPSPAALSTHPHDPYHSSLRQKRNKKQTSLAALWHFTSFTLISLQRHPHEKHCLWSKKQQLLSLMLSCCFVELINHVPALLYFPCLGLLPLQDKQPPLEPLWFTWAEYRPPFLSKDKPKLWFFALLLPVHPLSMLKCFLGMSREGRP